MTDTRQIQMQIEQVKDKISDIKGRADAVEKQMKQFNDTVNEIRSDLAILKSKLGVTK